MKTTIASLGIVVLIIGVALIYSSGNSDSGDVDYLADNVSIVDGKQIISIDVKGGYRPRKSIAKAGIPTLIRFGSSGTYDCSIAVRIPSLSIAKNIPPTGTTDINIGIPQAGRIQGMCAMGMYSFEVEFGA